MIRTSDINKEIREAEKLLKKEKVDAIELGKGILKLLSILVKGVRDIRTNQVTIMKQTNIKIPKPNPRIDGEETSEKEVAKDENKENK